MLLICSFVDFVHLFICQFIVILLVSDKKAYVNQPVSSQSGGVLFCAFVFIALTVFKKTYRLMHRNNSKIYFDGRRCVMSSQLDPSQILHNRNQWI